MMFIAVVLILILSAIIDYPLIMKASDIDDETQDPTNIRKVLLYAVAGFVVPPVVTIIVYKLLL
ncbi:MAG: hypothetical protein SPK70_01635 [Succinivibrio dextrinosolvens]|nr:hypothetical protein [Succinivibrio dextrinosolvens]MDY6469755.1 hypothetical protein [Succinivibrio dextrinosolvens]